MIARVVTLLLGLAIAATSVWEPRDVALHDVVVGLAIAAASFSGMVFPVVPHIYIGLVGGTLVFVFSLVPSSDRTFWPFGRAAPAKA